MLRSFGKRKATSAAVPDGVRVYAVGDVHGRCDLLDRMIAMIEADAHGFAGEARTVFLGDYIDRGPDSRGVIERLVEGPPEGHRWTCLIGNHDAILRDLLSGRADPNEVYFPWLEQGGLEAMQSYGLDRRDIVAGGAASVAALRRAIPASHTEFLNGLDFTYRAGDYVFVHAGVRPGVALGEQRRHDLVWIREAFLTHRGDFGAHIVHGHTISREVDAQRNRTGIDTGAYATGVLTALVLEGTARRVLRT